MTEDWRHGGFGLYIHWPFCKALCPYCDFNSYVSDKVDEIRWKAAYVSEIRRVGNLTRGRVLNSIYFGGGTPSLMNADLVAALIAAARDTWSFSNSVEITLEANPTSVDAGRFSGYFDAGVNRLSLGVQALNDADLKALGRLHSAKEAMAAYDLARSVFERVSFDLIYARQNQTFSEWRAELNRALALEPDHLSLYQLTIEAGTAFGDRFDLGKLPGLPTEDLAADMFFLTQETCEKMGLPGYEVSNHAAPGHESQHNLIYWRSGDYAGIGPGAHGRLTYDGNRHATSTELSPKKWLKLVEKSGNGDRENTSLTKTDHVNEFLMMGLRTTEGISIARLERFAGSSIVYNKISHLQEIGMVQLDDNTLKTTPNGRPVLNAILRELLT